MLANAVTPDIFVTLDRSFSNEILCVMKKFFPQLIYISALLLFLNSKLRSGGVDSHKTLCNLGQRFLFRLESYHSRSGHKCN
mmetsp:Transcript_30509/g.46214  ORF Transcript_30509/g.46214 Transcript_30509/m.46214 type:complete len:82 (-) Transcript_30509:870-1115(-)